MIVSTIPMTSQPTSATTTGQASVHIARIS
jgi:hypothetical protein